MSKTYSAILLYSDDIWNNDRDADFSEAKVVGKGKASESNCETYFPCGLYYEIDTTDDLGYQCLNILEDEMDVEDSTLKVITVALATPDGAKVNLQFPAQSRKFPVAFGGDDGMALTFYVDGVKTYKSSKGAKEKAKKFIEDRIEKLRSCDAPFAAESFGVEEMASEFSVERINPTPVSGKADMKAESFGAEENLAVADVEIWDGMNIPAGSGAIVGQAIPETDFTPFGASAEGYDDKLDESLGMSEKESKMKQSYKDRRDESKGTEKSDGARAYSRVGTMDKSAENLAVADVEIWDGMNIPAGSGAIVGQAIPETDFTPFGASAEESADPMPNESAIVGQTSDGTPYTRFGYAAENLAVQDVEVWDGMVLPEGTGNVMGQMTPSTDFTPFGVSAESCVKCAETFAACGCDDMGAESYMEETFKPDGMGEVIGAITEETDYTPFGASAEDNPEAFGGDLATLTDYEGVDSVRVEAPLGHGVTQNLGAEDMDSYGGMMGLVAAFFTGMAFRHWSNGKINGDDAPDSETPSEESDDAPQA
jgi:hypothetical protein